MNYNKVTKCEVGAAHKQPPHGADSSRRLILPREHGCYHAYRSDATCCNGDAVGQWFCLLGGRECRVTMMGHAGQPWRQGHKWSTGSSVWWWGTPRDCEGIAALMGNGRILSYLIGYWQTMSTGSLRIGTCIGPGHETSTRAVGRPWATTFTAWDDKGGIAANKC